jgi:hypothetical protein
LDGVGEVHGLNCRPQYPFWSGSDRRIYDSSRVDTGGDGYHVGLYRDKWSCDRPRIRYPHHGQLEAGKMVDQSAEITSVFPYLVERFRRLYACANAQKLKELLRSMQLKSKILRRLRKACSAPCLPTQSSTSTPTSHPHCQTKTLTSLLLRG